MRSHVKTYIRAESQPRFHN